MSGTSERTRAAILLREIDRCVPGRKAEHPPMVRAATGDSLLTKDDTWREGVAAARTREALSSALRWVCDDPDARCRVDCSTANLDSEDRHGRRA